MLFCLFYRYGTWKIEAKYKKSFTTTAFTKFEVKEYGNVWLLMGLFFISIKYVIQIIYLTFN